MDPIVFGQLNEAYHRGVYGQETLSEEEYLDIQEWVEALIDEGYDLDQYSDEELYEAYLDEVRGGGKVDPHNPDPSRGMKHSPYVKAGIKQVGIENQTIRRENEIRRKHKAPRVDPWEDPSDPDYREPPLRVVQATNRANRAAATDPKMGRLNKRYQKIGDVMDNMKEELDLYDLVSEYLVSEGFCDSYEDADVIMANMSEEWREGIVEEVLDEARVDDNKSRLQKEKDRNERHGSAPHYFSGNLDKQNAARRSDHEQQRGVTKVNAGLPARKMSEPPDLLNYKNRFNEPRPEDKKRVGPQRTAGQYERFARGMKDVPSNEKSKTIRAIKKSMLKRPKVRVPLPEELDLW